jgi:hypothetical protein
MGVDSLCVVVTSLGAMTRSTVELIRRPSRGEVLSDFWTRAVGVAGFLDLTLAGRAERDRVDAAAKRTPPTLSAGTNSSATVAAKLFTASLRLAFGATFARPSPLIGMDPGVLTETDPLERMSGWNISFPSRELCWSSE